MVLSMATNLRVFALNKEKKIIILDQNQTFENNKDIIKKRFGLETNKKIKFV